MNVQTIIRDKGSDVTTCGPTDSLASIATVLSDNKIGAVVIMQGRAIAGILSERDIVRAVARDGARALERPARDYMTKKVITCAMHETINEVMQKMSGGRFRHLPVVEDGALAGLVSIGDVVKRRIAEVEKEAETIREYIATA